MSEFKILPVEGGVFSLKMLRPERSDFVDFHTMGAPDWYCTVYFDSIFYIQRAAAPKGNRKVIPPNIDNILRILAKY